MSQDYVMELDELKEYIQQGREIEFSYKGRPYFMNPLYAEDDRSRCLGTKILDVEKEDLIFAGPDEQVLTFEFDPGISFSSSIDSFDFEYIL